MQRYARIDSGLSYPFTNKKEMELYFWQAWKTTQDNVIL